MPPEMLASLSPEMIVPLVAYLVDEKTEVNGQLFEAGAGWYGKVRWQRSRGAVFKSDESFTPAAVSIFARICEADSGIVTDSLVVL